MRFSPTKFRAIREASGLSQVRLGIAAGVPEKTIHRAETGKFVPRAETLADLAAVLQVNMEKFFTPNGDGE